MRINTVARGSSVSGIAPKPWAVLLRLDWVQSDWVRGLEGSAVSHTSSDTLTLCPQTPSAPPILTSAPSSCCGQKIFHDCCSHSLIAPQRSIALLGNSLEGFFFLSIRTAILTKAQVISDKHFAQIFIFFKQSSKKIKYNVLTFLNSVIRPLRATMLWDVYRIREQQTKIDVVFAAEVFQSHLHWKPLHLFHTTKIYAASSCQSSASSFILFWK